jgi:glyoxylase-like metal-dependent hydrolase (beta-lactamase superfamily II)
VDRLLDDWLAEHPQLHYPLVVAHTHAHGDHVAADGQFQGRPDTTVIGHTVEDVQSAFGIAVWPEGQGQLDLGDRVLDILPIPGHHPTSVAVYDPWSGLLLTGDTVYPGRLYVTDMPAFCQSLGRLAAWAHEHRVSAVVGCHIEMTQTPFRDFPLGSTEEGPEASWPLPPEHIERVRTAALGAGAPGTYRFDDFIIVHGQSLRVLGPLLMRAMWWRATRPLRRSKRRTG